MNRKQRRAATKAGPRLAPRTEGTDRQGEALFQSALQHHQAGRLQDAEALYRNALALAPRHAGALHYLGVLHHQTGRSEAGIALIREAIAADRQNAEPRYSLGLIHANLGQSAEAIAQTRKALKLNPDHAQAHTNLGALLLQQGDTRQAAHHFAEALARAPSQQAHENLAQALLEDGRPGEALDVTLRGLQHSDSRNLKATFVLIAQALDPADAARHPGLREALVKALTEPWCRPRDLAATVTALLLHDPALANALQRSDVTSDADWLRDPATVACPNDALLGALLVTTPVADIALERGLTWLRRALLAGHAAGATLPDELRGVALALAQQCFINDYVFDIADDERDRAAAVRDALAQELAAAAPADPARVLIAAAYGPLHAIAGADRLLDQPQLAPLQPLLAQQIREPRAEQEIRRTIPALTPIADPTSTEVRAQYEESPYPRWTRIVAGQPPLPIDSYIRARFPHAAATPLGSRPIELLMAGCGTGMHTIERVLLFRPGRTLAIDLSLASLSYAARKSREAGLTDIDYAQADILALPALGRSFDVIDASGVLHHMRDPFEGWRALLRMLRPGGLMHVALYSVLARQDIRAVREMAAGRYPSTPDGIRALRRDIVALDAGDPRRRVAAMTDFFSASECRDLLLHVQEHQLSIPEIAAFLDAERLRFLGFETPATARYRERFPDDPAATDLTNWSRFESERPATFARMYQFWIQKPAD